MHGKHTVANPNSRAGGCLEKLRTRCDGRGRERSAQTVAQKTAAGRIWACALRRAPKRTRKQATTMHPAASGTIPRCLTILLLIAAFLLHPTKLRCPTAGPWVALLGPATAPRSVVPVSIATDPKLRRSRSNTIAAAERHVAGLLVRPCHTPAAAVIVISRRIATVTARRSDHVGMRLHGDGPACRNEEATGMTVLSTSGAVPLKPPWYPTDAGQMSAPSASRTLLYGAHRCVRWDR